MSKHSDPNSPSDDADPLMDWGLSERLRNRKPVDLIASVHAALQRERLPSSAPPPQRRSWLLAAGVLLGSAVVLTIALSQPEPDSRTAQQPDGTATDPAPTASAEHQGPPPKPVHVSSLKDVEALPRNTRAVEASGVNDAVIAALTNLRGLEVLIVREPWNESFGLGLKIAAPKDPQHITNACWQQFAKFTKLRVLTLSGTSLIARIRTGHGDDVVTALEHLPLLEQLSLRMLDCDDEVLQRLPKLRNLRRLDLAFNNGFTQEGFQALLQCRQLVTLSLQGCQQLHGSVLGTLHELPKLEVLDLRSLDQWSWRAGTGEPDDQEGNDLKRRARRIADSLTAGVNDSALRGLAKAPRLRVLEISNGYWTANGLGELGKSESLRELSMFGGQEANHSFVEHLPAALTRLEVCADFDDAFCRAVRAHLPNIRHINIAACDKISDRGLAELLKIPSLRVLDLRQMRGLTEAAIEDLAAATQLEELDLRHNDFVSAAHIRQLTRALPKLKKLDSNH